MGKNYVENSLKRFLKRKVKITMGVVVSFLITGAVAFSEGTTETVKDLEYLLLKNTQENNFCPGMCPEGIKFNPEGETLTLSENDELKLNSEIYHNHGDIIVENTYALHFTGSNTGFHNYGNINGSKKYIFYVDDKITTDIDIYNYGKINSNNHYTFFVKNSSYKINIYNYGDILLKSKENSPKAPLMFLQGNSNTTIYNYGSMIALKNPFSTNTNANIFIRGNVDNGNANYNIVNNGYINVYKTQIQTDISEERINNNGVIISEVFTNGGKGGNPSFSAASNVITNNGLFITKSSMTQSILYGF